MNRVAGAIIGILVVGGVVGCGPPFEPSVPTPAPVRPSASPVEPPSATPVAVETSGPTPSPVAIATLSPRPTPTPTPSPTGPTPTPTTSLPPAGGKVRLPKLAARVPGATSIRYFRIGGTSPDDLLADVVRRSQAVCNSSHTLACVLQRPSVTWTNRTNFDTGACTIVAPKVSLTSTVHLPRWVRPKRVEPALLDWWREMLDHMAWHEGRHIAIQMAFNNRLERQMAGEPCRAANKIYRRWQRSVQKAQDRFDARDASWPYPEYTGPTGP